MADARIAHDLDCSEDTFWKLFFDKEYNEELFLRVLGFEGWKIVSQDETESRIVRVVDAIPRSATSPGR